MQFRQSLTRPSNNGQRKPLALAIAACGLALAPAATSVAGDDPYMKPDESWITISGTVESVMPDSFMLDYGDGVVTVEMDDGDRDADAYKLLRGDEVAVSGRIDDDFYETTSIEASSVYVKNIGTTFYSSAVDDEDWSRFTDSVTAPLAVSRVSVIGKVTDVDEHEFTVDDGIRAVRVDVNDMTYDPLDDDGYQKIEIGDRVKVVGDIDRDLFAGREIDADLIVELHDA